MSHILPSPNTPQLKVIDTYLKSLATFDLTVLKTLRTDDFLMITAPANMNVPDKTKKEDLAFLEEMKESLNSQHLEVSRAPMISHSYKTLICSTVYHIRCRRRTGEDLGPCMITVFFRIDRPETDFSTFI
jgi:hypothetical protein